jgi:hypothetical protein
LGCISLTGSEIFELFYRDPSFIIDLSKYINVEAELKKYPNMAEKHMTRYLEFLELKKINLVWEEQLDFHDFRDMQNYWLECL